MTRAASNPTVGATPLRAGERGIPVHEHACRIVAPDPDVLDVEANRRYEDVHLIVMGVYGRNPIDLAFFGSTTNHVVRAANCPVLTLKT